jgi:hypothetical protein
MLVVSHPSTMKLWMDGAHRFVGVTLPPFVVDCHDNGGSVRCPTAMMMAAAATAGPLPDVVYVSA